MFRCSFFIDTGQVGPPMNASNIRTSCTSAFSFPKTLSISFPKFNAFGCRTKHRVSTGVTYIFLFPASPCTGTYGASWPS